MKEQKYGILAVLMCLVFMTVGCGNSNEDKGLKDEIILTYATMNLDNEMGLWITEYNTAHENCHIEVQEYGMGDYETGLKRLNAEIMSGNVPDIIDLSELSIEVYNSSGILTDLYSLMDADSKIEREDFIPNILQLYEKNEKIYGITPGFRLETLMGKKTEVGEPAHWTLEKVKKMIEEMPPENSFVHNLSPMGLLRITLVLGLEEYINWEAGTCSFDEAEFIQLLQLADTMEELPMLGGDMEENLFKGNLLLNRANISDVMEYIESVDMFRGEEVVCVGYPSLDGGSSLVSPYLPIGISNMCENKEAAWEFVSSLLGEEFQDKHIRFNFPIRISSLEKKFKQAMEMEPNNSYSFENTWIEVTQEDIDALYEVINASCDGSVVDNNLWNIIEEEAEIYFNGQKTAEETATVIQNRVSIYVSENEGMKSYVE